MSSKSENTNLLLPFGLSVLVCCLFTGAAGYFVYKSSRDSTVKSYNGTGMQIAPSLQTTSPEVIPLTAPEILPLTAMSTPPQLMSQVSSPPYPAVKVSGNNSIKTLDVAANSLVKLPAILYDITTMYDITTGLFTIPKDGIYRIGMSIVQTTNLPNNYRIQQNDKLIINLSQKATGYGNEAAFCYQGSTDHFFAKGSTFGINSMNAVQLYCGDSATSQIYCSFIH